MSGLRCLAAVSFAKKFCAMPVLKTRFGRYQDEISEFRIHSGISRFYRCHSFSQVAWAFGIGLERVAMLYYGIEDIRAFWSEDPGFHAQFNFSDPYKRIKFKPISTHPSCSADMSFWIPSQFEPNDFYDIVSLPCLIMARPGDAFIVA